MRRALVWGVVLAACRGTHETRSPTPTTTVANTAPTPSPSSCDEQLDAGNEAYSRGDDYNALKAYEAAYNCKPDPHTVDLAFLVACRLAKVGAARKYWHKMASSQQNRLAVVCLRNAITRDQLDP